MRCTTMEFSNVWRYAHRPITAVHFAIIEQLIINKSDNNAHR